jgi:Rrf2 family protein
MRLTRKADYGIRALYHIACQPPEKYCSVEEIGRTEGIPEGFLAKVVGELVRGGLLHSRRGMDGGLRLARPASEITVFDVIQVLEGPMEMNECLGPDPICRWLDICPMRRIWINLQDLVEERLRSVTVARLARHERMPARAGSR